MARSSRVDSLSISLARSPQILLPSSQYAMFYALEQGFTFIQVSFAELQGFLLQYTQNFHIFAGGHPSDQAVDGVANNSMPCNLRTQHAHIPQARDLPLVTVSELPLQLYIFSSQSHWASSHMLHVLHPSFVQ